MAGLGGDHRKFLKSGRWKAAIQSYLARPGTRSSRPVDLMSVYPTLCELAGIERPGHVEGHSIVPLLKNPNQSWEHPAVTTYGKGNHAVRTETHRYIRYENGDKEFYHSDVDPYEWTNLANYKQYEDLMDQLAKHLPGKEINPAPRELT